MSRRAAAAAVALLGVTTVGGPVGACTLALHDARSGDLVRQVPLSRAELVVAFRHSVLGTPVRDRYVWSRDHWRLVEEHFEGSGYGLPHAAQAGEQLVRDGAGWRLLTDRSVNPLIVRDVPETHMQIEAVGVGAWRVAELGARAVRVTAEHCDTASP